MNKLSESKIAPYVFKMKSIFIQSIKEEVIPWITADKLYYPDKKYNSQSALDFIINPPKYGYDDHGEIRSNDLLYNKIGSALVIAIHKCMNLLGDKIEKPQTVTYYPQYAMSAAVGIPEYDETIPSSKISPKLLKFSDKIQTDLYHYLIAEVRKIAKPTTRTNISKYQKAIADAFDSGLSLADKDLNEFVTMILHEITHLAQWKSSKSDTYFPNIGINAMGKKKKDWGKNPDIIDGYDLDYLADYNEIDAYANECAAKLLITHKAENKKINVNHMSKLAENLFYIDIAKKTPKILHIFKRFMRTLINNLNAHNDNL